VVVSGSVVVVLGSVVVVVASVVVVGSVVVVVGVVVVVVDVVEVVFGLVVVVAAGGWVVVVAAGGWVVGVIPGAPVVVVVMTVGVVTPGPIPGLGIPRRGGGPPGIVGLVVIGETSAGKVVTASLIVVLHTVVAAPVPGVARMVEPPLGRHALTGSRSGSATSPTAATSTYTTFPGLRTSRRA
jgi:hypothetical protein